MTRRILLVAGGIITLIFALFVFAPGFAPIQALSTYFPFAQVLSFPRVFAPFVAALCVIVYLMTVLAAYVRRRRLAKVDGVRTPRRFVGLILICVMNVSSIWVVVAPSGHLTSETRPLQTGEAKDVTLVAFNTLRNLDGETMQYMIDRFDPDILVLPETSQLEVEEAILGTNFVGYSYVGTPDLGGASPTTVMTNPRLGIWHQRKGPNTTFGTVTLQNTDSDMPMIVATHTSPLCRGA
ncbi:hypothetical protein G7066_05215 [Leucobacter coleopterorum]|uniref:Endonuclease/Exonuclease/phosphatase family protein n=1 Tax=Leucobacter coleopterorum TaxID=2714933 RepID=A0ABX6JV90_9MICO|nr:hypothetical protein [Leucobacter coleopterorum]QIM18205.1 hypothetical protein G7066_05215 [Leucobacter coleopterorum]